MQRRFPFDPLAALLIAGGLVLLTSGRGGRGALHSSTPYKTNSASALHPDLRVKLDRVFARLRAQGFQPAIGVSWRNLAWQEQAYRDGRSKIRFSAHNATSPSGTPAALAADVVDRRYGWPSGNPDTNRAGWDAAAGFFRALRAAAVAEGLRSGGNYSQSGSWKRYGLGWDPAHVVAIHETSARLAALKRGDFASAGVRAVA